jgi:hypothetical protein
VKALLQSSANCQVNVIALAYSLEVRSNMKTIDSSTRKRRIFMGSALTLLIVTTTAIQIQNSELANALIPIAQTPFNPPMDISAEIDSPAVGTPPTDPITQKLLADGCNLNASPTATQHDLGTCKVLVIGDSLGQNLGYGLLGQLRNKPGLTVTMKAKASTGLSNAWFYNWHVNQAAFIKTYKPNLVIVLMGANDRQNFVVNGKIQTFGNLDWQKTYQTNVTMLASAATASGAYVVWVGLPIMKPYNYAKGETLIDKLIAAAVPKTTGAQYIPLRELTADASGKYQQSAIINGKYQVFRGGDGIHFSSVGQEVIATYTINKINRLFHVKLTPNISWYIKK